MSESLYSDYRDENKVVYANSKKKEVRKMATPLNAMLSRMADLDHQDVDKDLMGMIYGGPGAGKTTTAMALAQQLRGEGKVLLLDSAEGFVSLEAMPGLAEATTIVPNVTSKELAAVSEALLKRTKDFKDYTVVVIDEASSLAQEVLENVVRERAGVTIGEELPEIEGRDYGPMTQIMGAIIRRLQKVEGLHVIIVAHDREKEDKRRGLLISPQFTPLLLKEIQKLMHVTGYQVARIDAKGSYTYQVQARPTVSVQAKSRIPATPVIQSPEEFVEFVSTWALGTSIAHDLNLPEGDEEIPEGALPVDGPALEPEDDLPEDEPVFMAEG